MLFDRHVGEWKIHNTGTTVEDVNDSEDINSEVTMLTFDLKRSAKTKYAQIAAGHSRPQWDRLYVQCTSLQTACKPY